MNVSTLSQSLNLQTSISKMRSEFTKLQQQLSTGVVSDSYGGLGADKNVVLSLQSQMRNLDAYSDTINLTSLRVKSMADSLTRVSDISSGLRLTGSTTQFDMVSGTQNSGQLSAGMNLDELVNLLNLNVEDRYLFAGSATQKKPVELPDAMLNGDASHAGLTQLIDERRQADTGANGLGRLDVTSPAADTVAVGEQAGIFGFKMTGATSDLSGATVTGPTGTPASISVQFGAGQPVAGDTLSIDFDLPDGTTTSVTLTATTDDPAAEGQFTIGTTAADTAANFQASLEASLKSEAATSLRAASSVQAANEFFDFDASNPPQRVDGPPFDTATGLRDATSDDTVFWYQGDLTLAPGANMTAVIDNDRIIKYGAQANQTSLRDTVKAAALLSAVTYDKADPDAEQAYKDLTSRVSTITAPSGSETVEGVVTQLGLTASTLQETLDRNEQMQGIASGVLGDKMGIDEYEVGTKLTTLQTQLQASYQVTSMLSQLSLVNFL